MSEKHSFSILLSLFTLIVMTVCSKVVIAQDTVWTWTYGGLQSDFLYAVEPASDGNYIETGAYSIGSHGAVLLVKFDANGDTAGLIISEAPTGIMVLPFVRHRMADLLSREITV